MLDFSPLLLPAARDVGGRKKDVAYADILGYLRLTVYDLINDTCGPFPSDPMINKWRQFFVSFFQAEIVLKVTPKATILLSKYERYVGAFVC